MAINLKKGQKVDLTKGNSDLKRLLIGLGWGSAKTSSPLSLLMEFLSDFLYSADDIDLDVTAFICANGRLEDKKDIVYYAHLNHYSGAVKHTGDNRTGQGDGDDEQIYVDLEKLPPKYDKIAFVMNLYQSFKTTDHLGMIENAFIRIYDNDTHKELCRYNLSDNYNGMKAVIVGELYREDGKWFFNPIGKGTTDDSIDEMAERYK